MNAPSPLPFDVPQPIGAYDIDVLRKHPEHAQGIVKNTARDMFLEQGKLALFTLIFGRKLPPWEPCLPSGLPHADILWVTLLKTANNESKELFSQALPHMLHAMGASAVAMCFESWFVPHTAEELPELLAWRAAHGGSIAEHPRVMESVYVQYETKFGITAWSAPIHRTKEGVKLGCFMQFDRAVEGRFMHLLVDFDTPVQA